MSKILIIFLIAALLGGSGCFYKSYFRDDNWVYFEDWDVNDDTKLDKAEFVQGYERDEFKDSQSPEQIFNASDENADGLLSGLEFYRWEANRATPVKRDSTA